MLTTAWNRLVEHLAGVVLARCAVPFYAEGDLLCTSDYPCSPQHEPVQDRRPVEVPLPGVGQGPAQAAGAMLCQPRLES